MASKMCEKCGYRTSDASNFSRHMRTHGAGNGKSYSCLHCSQKFRDSYGLKRHFEAAHSSRRQEKCDKCHKNFASVDSLREHKRTQHGNQQSFKCDVCSRTFTRKSDMERHRSTHPNRK